MYLTLFNYNVLLTAEQNLRYLFKIDYVIVKIKTKKYFNCFISIQLIFGINYLDIYFVVTLNIFTQHHMSTNVNREKMMSSPTS